MAQIREVKLLDDLHRFEESKDVPADVTTQFGLDGKVYEIDLATVNDELLRDALAPFIAAARKVPATARPSTRSVDRLNRETSQEIREWARSRDMEVSDRGRIPAEIREAYNRAHGKASAQA